MTRTIPRVITAEWLIEQGACPSQVRAFRRLFPDGARATKTNLLRAAGKLDLFWFAEAAGWRGYATTAAYRDYRPVAAAWSIGDGDFTKIRAKASAPIAEDLWLAIRERVQ